MISRIINVVESSQSYADTITSFVITDDMTEVQAADLVENANTLFVETCVKNGLIFDTDYTVELLLTDGHYQNTAKKTAVQLVSSDFIIMDIKEDVIPKGTEVEIINLDHGVGNGFKLGDIGVILRSASKNTPTPVYRIRNKKQPTEVDGWAVQRYQFKILE